MQAIENNGLTRPMEPYNSEVLEQHLKDPKIKEVKVFKLKEGMTLDIAGMPYKVSRVRSNGKITLKPKTHQ